MDYTDVNEVRQEFVTQLSTSSTAVDASLAKIITFASREMDRIAGRRFFTTTGDEVRTFDGPRNCYQREFRLPMELAAFTQLRMAASEIAASSGTWATISTGDLFLDPDDKPDNFPWSWISLISEPSGTYNSSAPYSPYFSTGKRVIEITGRWGWNATSVNSTNFPQELRLVAIELSIKLWRSREAGFSNIVGVSDVGTALVERLLSPISREILESYKRPMTR